MGIFSDPLTNCAAAFGQARRLGMAGGPVEKNLSFGGCTWEASKDGVFGSLRTLKWIFWSCADVTTWPTWHALGILIWHRPSSPVREGYRHGGGGDGSLSAPAQPSSSAPTPQENPGSQWDVGERRRNLSRRRLRQRRGGGWDTGNIVFQ